jgi:hypothetical protein
MYSSATYTWRRRLLLLHVLKILVVALRLRCYVKFKLKIHLNAQIVRVSLSRIPSCMLWAVIHYFPLVFSSLSNGPRRTQRKGPNTPSTFCWVWYRQKFTNNYSPIILSSYVAYYLSEFNRRVLESAASIYARILHNNIYRETYARILLFMHVFCKRWNSQNCSQNVFNFNFIALYLHQTNLQQQR